MVWFSETVILNGIYEKKIAKVGVMERFHSQRWFPPYCCAFLLERLHHRQFWRCCCSCCCCCGCGFVSLLLSGRWLSVFFLPSSLGPGWNGEREGEGEREIPMSSNHRCSVTLWVVLLLLLLLFVCAITSTSSASSVNVKGRSGQRARLAGSLLTSFPMDEIW